MGDVTQILSAIEDGDTQAAEQLLPLVFTRHGWQRSLSSAFGLIVDKPETQES